MRLTREEARSRFVRARVLRLATVDAEGRPHLVPATFAADGDALVMAVDHKPKRHTDLKRLRNIAGNDAVCALVDVYDDDWSRLWWARADGTARILEDGPGREHRLARLTARYPQYRTRPPEGPFIVVDVDRWSGWCFTAHACTTPGS